MNDYNNIDGYEAFQDELLKLAKCTLEGTADVILHNVRKNNSTMLQGLVITPFGASISPTIYLNSYYEEYLDGRTIDSIFSEIINIYENSRISENVDFSHFNEFESCKDNICFKLISRDHNEELLKTVPWMPFLDLAVIFYFYIPSFHGERGSIVVDSSIAQMWGVNTETLYKTACTNTSLLFSPDFFSMGEFLQNAGIELPSDSKDDVFCSGTPLLYVLTTNEKMYGASVILYPGVLKRIADELGNDLYILPSSIHELIVASATLTDDPSQLNLLIREVNEKEVPADEYLSDHSREQKKIYIDDTAKANGSNRSLSASM